jgi:hypothetical protein
MKLDFDEALGSKDSFDDEQLYHKAIWMRKNRLYGSDRGKVQEYLKRLAEEAHLHLKIAAVEIFRVGEIFYEAREMAQGSFKEWVEKNFNISYDTALNFIHVYECLFGHQEFLEGVKPSILYKVADPSFPEELRNFLLEDDNAKALKDMTNRDVTELVKRYKAKGWEGVAKTFERGVEFHRVYAEVSYPLNLLHKLAREIELMRRSMANHINNHLLWRPMTRSAVSTKILNDVYNGLGKAITFFDELRKECDVELRGSLGEIEESLLEDFGAELPKKPKAETDTEIFR